MDLDLSSLLIIVTAGFCAGFVNTVVGSGSLLTFPALLLTGLPPVPANISNTVGLSIGNLMGVVGYRRELSVVKGILGPLLLTTVLFAGLGAYLLLVLPSEVFSQIAPWLIGTGTLLVLIQPLIRPTKGERTNQKHEPESPTRTLTALPLTALTGAYGGYFGAAQGVLIVGILGSIYDQTVHTINAIKNVLQTAAGFAAAVVFLIVGTIDWTAVLIIGGTSIVGAMIGAKIGRHLAPWVFRTFVAVVGVGSIFLLVSMR